MVRRPSNISLPSLKSVLDEDVLWSGNPVEATNDVWYGAAQYQPSPRNVPPEAPVTPQRRTVSSPVEYRGFRSINQDDQKTPKQLQTRTPLVYPSPASEDLFSDVEMGDASAWGYKSQPPSGNNDIQIRNAPHVRTPSATSNPEATLTPTMVHYRPNGVPNAKSRKLSATERIKRPGQVTSPKTSGEVKFKIVKWDRTSDKGTAPLNMEPRPHGPRSCTLCSVLKRKVLLPIQPTRN